MIKIGLFRFGSKIELIDAIQIDFYTYYIGYNEIIC